MDTNDLKRLIGSYCLVIDPRSKKKVFEPATIISASFSAQAINRTGEIYEHVRFRVELHRLTTTKKKRCGGGYEYHRCFDVSGDRIQIPSWH